LAGPADGLETVMLDYDGLGSEQRPNNWSNRGSRDVDDVRFANQAAQLGCARLANDAKGQERVASVVGRSLRDESGFKTRGTAGGATFSKSGSKGPDNRLHSTDAGQKKM
jgi:hypothetical protein